MPYRKFGNQEKDLKEYMLFLDSLINTNDASLFTELVYLTGVLPMKKVSAKPLPNLREYRQLQYYELTPYYGFTLDEAKKAKDEGLFSKASVDERLVIKNQLDKIKSEIDKTDGIINSEQAQKNRNI